MAAVRTHQPHRPRRTRPTGRPRRGALARAVAAGLLAAALAACGAGVATGGGALAPTGSGDWPTYHGDTARTGAASGVPPLGTLRHGWTARLDGAVYGQPLVVRGRVIAATENNTVYALDPGSGRTLWHRHLAGTVLSYRS